MTDFLSFKNRYFVSADLIMERPFHIGKGTSLEPVGTDLPVVKTLEGIPYIPGSSIKGAMRAKLEQILRTLDTQGFKWNGQKIWACDPLDNSNCCVTDSKRKQMQKKHTLNGNLNDTAFTAELLNAHCTACRLFGSPWVASRIYFKDMYLINKDEILKLFEIRDGVGIDRDTGTAKKGMKFDYEIVPSWTKFRLEAILENVEDWEVGLFSILLKLGKKGEIALGGKVSSGLGWARIENIKIDKVDKTNLIDFVLSDPTGPGGIPVDINRFISEFRNKMRRETSGE